MTVDYSALVRFCFTVNAYNRVHIELENRLPPMELASLQRSVERSGAAKPTMAWLAQLRQLSAEMFERPQPFAARQLAPGLTMFEDVRVPPAGKSILIAFCGNGNRLLLPVPVFLQFMAAARWDVLLVQKGVGGSYARGIGEISGGVAGIVGAVRRLARPDRYRSVSTFGTSGGGGAAIAAAILLGAARGVSVCGGSIPDESGVAAAGPAGPDLLYAFGEAHAPDRIAAASMMKRFGGRMLPVPDVDQHNAFAPLLARGEFGAYLATMLGEASDANVALAEPGR